MQGNLVHIQEAVPSREHFLLPTLGPKLEKLGEEVRIGRGFQLLRYVAVTPPARWLRARTSTLCAGTALQLTPLCGWLLVAVPVESPGPQ